MSPRPAIVIVVDDDPSVCRALARLLDGIEALRSLAAEGAELTGASPYVQLLLEQGTP